jgi:glycosyltransferase involved in cell wall biosynthesis
MNRPSVTVVVPTKNAARTLHACLESVVSQSVRCGLVVVDCGSGDDTKAIAAKFADLVVDSTPNVSLQRNIGARALPADIVGFVDADMIAGAHVVEQAVEQIEAGSGSVVVPERSFGRKYWARVRTFERSMYLGGGGAMEWPRFFTSDLFQAVGGYDEGLIAMEDTDLGLRANARAKAGRTADVFLHGRAEVPCRVPQKGRLRIRDRRLPPQARRSGDDVAPRTPVLRAPVAASGPAIPGAWGPGPEGRRSSGRRRPSPAR